MENSHPKEKELHEKLIASKDEEIAGPQKTIDRLLAKNNYVDRCCFYNPAFMLKSK